ncbi:MAG: transporter substrate-binding domain-containing protein, partial [Treponema sp.]|nr:transporter substrate-binding domain-containing protein [Treponema sp.]
MKVAKKLVCAALILLAAAGTVFAGGKKDEAPAAPSTGNADLDRIVRAGLLKVGVKSDVPGFGLLNPDTGKYEGLEIDMAKLIAKEIFGDENRVAFTPVTAKTRGPLLDNGDIDFVIATFTVTEERKLTY